MSTEPLYSPDAFPPSLERAARRACRRSEALGTIEPRGAALLTSSGGVFAASDLPESPGSAPVCAERAAVWRAVHAGERDFRALVIRGGADGLDDGGPPCGPCLQVLYEFSPGASVWWGTAREPKGGLTVRALIPDAFRGAHLSGADREIAPRGIASIRTARPRKPKGDGR